MTKEQKKIARDFLDSIDIGRETQENRTRITKACISAIYKLPKSFVENATKSFTRNKGSDFFGKITPMYPVVGEKPKPVKYNLKAPKHEQLKLKR